MAKVDAAEKCIVDGGGRLGEICGPGKETWAIDQYMSLWHSHLSGQVFVEIMLLAGIIICGSVGNLLIIISTLMYRHMRTTSNVILSIQATCDLALCCSIPLIMVVRITSHWSLGNVACKVWMFQLSFSQGITTLCMSALAIDRYYCICRPQSFNFLKRYPYVTSAVIVLGSLCVNTPFILGWNTLTLEKNHVWYTFCGLRWPNSLDNKAYIYLMLISDFFFPLLISVILYSVIWSQVRASAKRVVNVTSARSTGNAGTKLLKMLILSFILYVLMFLPFVSVSVLLFYTQYISSSAFLVILALMLADTVVNPVLLSVFNVKYRACMQAIVTCKITKDPGKVTPTAQRPNLDNVHQKNTVEANCRNNVDT